MAKQQSQREKDLARRSRSRPAAGGGKTAPKLLGVVAIGVAIALIAWAAWPAPVAASRESNFEAFGLADDPFLGNASAPVVLVGYESPHCSSCKQFHNVQLPRLQSEFFDTGKVVYHYMQGSIGGDFDSSVAQECAHTHGGNDAFWSITHSFYARDNTYSTPDLEAMLRQVAEEQELDAEVLVDCLTDSEASAKVSQDWRVGSAMGVRGTPTFWAFGPDGEAVRITSSSAIPGTLENLLASSGAT